MHNIKHNISNENYHIARERMNKIIKPENFACANTMFNEDMSWYELMVTLCTYHISAHTKYVPLEKTIKKTIDINAFNKFLNKIAMNLNKDGKCYDYEKGSLLGENKNIRLHTRNQAIIKIEKSTLYYDPINKCLTDEMPQITNDIVSKIKNKITNEIQSLINKEKNKKKIDKLKNIIDVVNNNSKVKIFNRNLHYMNNNFVLIMNLHGMNIKNYYNIFSIKEENLSKNLNLSDESIENIKYAYDIIDNLLKNSDPKNILKLKNYISINNDISFVSEINKYDYDRDLIKKRMMLDNVYYNIFNENSKKTKKEIIDHIFHGKLNPSYENKYKKIERYIEESLKKHDKSLKIIEKFDNKLRVDKITEHMLNILKDNGKFNKRELLSKAYKSYKVPIEALNGFCSIKNVKKDKKISIIIHVSQGIIKSSFRLTDNIEIKKNEIILDYAVPKTILSTLVGKDAKEVIDHPINKLLGPVTSVKAYENTVHIRFKTILNIFDQEKYFAK